MLTITTLTDYPLQQQTVILPDGTSFFMELYYRTIQQGWFINTLTYGDFTLNGLRICNLTNMLYQWSNIIPFGLGCFSVGNREPSLIQDFSSGNSTLYVLTQDEVDQYKNYIMTGSF